MRRFFYPIKDATIYQEFPNRQAGLDEIVEVGKSDNGRYRIRSLLGFDIAALSASISAGTVSPAASYDFKLFLAKATKLQLNQVVNVHQLSSSWDEGSGYFYQDMRESTDGATWKYRQTGSVWNAASTGSVGSLWVASVSSSVSGGGDYYVSSSASVQTAEPITDLTFDVTSYIQSWVSGAISNDGFLVKFSDGGENSDSNYGRLKFFSRNTHTVFSPVLIAKWDDSIYNTSSWTPASSSTLTVFPVNLHPEYKQGEVARIDLVARELYPMKTFTTQFEAWKNRYLPTTSYYSIVDVQSQEVIIPFDDNSKIGVDANSNFITFAVEKMFPRRYYKMMFKVIFPDGHKYIFDEHYNFTVAL